MSDKKFNSLKDNLKKLQHCSSPGWHREVLEEREKCVHEGCILITCIAHQHRNPGGYLKE